MTQSTYWEKLSGEHLIKLLVEITLIYSPIADTLSCSEIYSAHKTLLICPC